MCEDPLQVRHITQLYWIVLHWTIKTTLVMKQEIRQKTTIIPNEDELKNYEIDVFYIIFFVLSWSHHILVYYADVLSRPCFVTNTSIVLLQSCFTLPRPWFITLVQPIHPHVLSHPCFITFILSTLVSSVSLSIPVDLLASQGALSFWWFYNCKQILTLL